MDECRFFQTKQGCRFGDKCRFIHVEEMSGSSMDVAYESRKSGKSHGGNGNNESLVEGDQRVEQFHSPLYRQRNGCKFFNTKRGCSRGDKCTFLHGMRDNDSNGKTSYNSQMLGSEQKVIVGGKAHNPRQRKGIVKQVASNDTKSNQKTDVDAPLEFEKLSTLMQEGHDAHVSTSRTHRQRSRTIPSNKNKEKQAEDNEGIPPFRQKSRAKNRGEVFKGDSRKIKENAVGTGPPSKEEVVNKYTISGKRILGVFIERNDTGSPNKDIETKGVNKYKNSSKWQVGVLTEKNETMSPNQDMEAKEAKHRDLGTNEESLAKAAILNKDNNVNNKHKQRYSKPYTSENYTSSDRGMYTLADAIFAEPKRLRSTEIQQLKRRFGGKNGFFEIKENSVYKVQFKPTDPDWPFKIEAVYLTVSFPEDYPLHIFSALLSKEQDLPENIFSFVNQRIQEYTAQQEQMGHNQGNMKLYFRPFLRWFDKNLVSFFTDAGKELRIHKKPVVPLIILVMTKVFVSRMGLIDTTGGEIFHDQPKTMANAADSSPNSTQDLANMEEGSNGCDHDTVPVSQVMESCQKNTMVVKENTKKTFNAEINGWEVKHTFFENSEDFIDDNKVNELAYKGKVENTYGTGICGGTDNRLDLRTPKQDTEGIMFGSQANHEQACSNEHALESSLSNTHGNDSTLLKTVERGTRIQFKGLHLEESTSSMRANKVSFTLECSRCKQRMDQQLAAAVSVFKQCTRCASAFAVMYRPTVIHQFSSILGYLDIDGCLPFDVVLPESELMLGCFHCSKETLVKGLQYGGNQSWCSHCHQKLRFQVQCTRFQQLQSGVSNTEVSLQKSTCTISSTSSKPKKTLRNPGLKEGQPLPGNGTCKHYKKSYRWLRFPCCGKCYACDVCHEEAEDHEMKFATRMVCGFCSKEQPYSQQPCSGCKAAVTKSHSAHWEGGKGCRDKVTMSRNDNRKYRQTGKTTSRKAQKQSEGKGKGK